MNKVISPAIWIFVISVTAFLMYVLSPVLTPFMLGILFAYVANPVVRLIDRFGVPHLLSVTLVFVVLFGVLLAVSLMLFPLIEHQMVALVNALPGIFNWLETVALPWLKSYISLESLQTTITSSLPKAGWILKTIVSSGNTIVGIAVTCVLTPVITFYFLRDYDSVLANLKSVIPNSVRPTAVRLAKECDEVLGAFIRGQLIIMLALAFVYGFGLTLTGLKLGLALGMIGGLLSIVPYLGSIFIVISATVAAMVQFGTLESVVWVIVVYMIGQALEGYVLTPMLVGNRIGLHPVAVIFSVMAGGALFGFFGVLLALPAAAVIMVLLRYARSAYA